MTGSPAPGKSTTITARIRTTTIGTFGAVSSRRGVLRMLGSVAAAAVATGRGHPVAAMRKNHHRKPTGTNGQTVTRTFTNPNPIAINTSGSATPFPSRILVSGFANATITDVNLVLSGFGHTIPADVDVMVVAPDGRNALVMSDVGNSIPVVGLTIRLDDAAGAELPGMVKLTSETFRPTNLDDGSVDIFDATAAPMPSGNVVLSTFNGSDPNGEWRLFIRDDYPGEAGSVSGGWALEITATTPARKKKKHKKKR